MLRVLSCLCGFVLAWDISAAELQFSFSQDVLNQTPRGFQSILSGGGKPGEWKIISEEVGPAISALTSNTPALTKRPVLAQVSMDLTDERFPMLVYDEETFVDFTLTTRFKNVSGVMEQMAGIAFRIQDTNNYYYVRASSLGNTFRFFKIVGGQRSAPIGPEVEIPKGVWHELAVECKGNSIRCSLNGKELIPMMTDNSFSSGKIGFWTKSDSVSYFADTKVIYTPREPLAKVVIREMLRLYPRLVGLKVYAVARGKPGLRIIASSDEKDIGNLANRVEQDVVARGIIYFGKEKQTAIVTLPLHDRNGDTVAAVRVILKSFFGQTEHSAIARALPIIKEMENRIRSAKDLLE
jgi:hypothetical protein